MSISPVSFSSSTRESVLATPEMEEEKSISRSPSPKLPKFQDKPQLSGISLRAIERAYRHLDFADTLRDLKLATCDDFEGLKKTYLELVNTDCKGDALTFEILEKCPNLVFLSLYVPVQIFKNSDQKHYDITWKGETNSHNYFGVLKHVIRLICPKISRIRFVAHQGTEEEALLRISQINQIANLNQKLTNQ
ncbi:MAG: hypothetical protein COT85_06570 [Chlamydiae bacterium CG10_big_fil_rev_8_21_14_0_10_42_34]|nr:MAG: hypothetical protein COT85_06570 [Chlamydiae bacterium CG10_big_fil_rev_8_21_14_0_10_42_34]